MKVSSNDIYVNGEYYTNNPRSGIDDAQWKAGIIFNLLKKNNIVVKEVVEVGCGLGQVLIELGKRDEQLQKLTGYDISPQAIELAMKNTSDKIKFINEDFTTKENIKNLCLQLM